MPASTRKPVIELIVGPAHSAKTGRILASFRDALDAGDEAVLILPTARAATSLRTELLLDGTFDFFGGPRVLTFVTFAEQVLEHEAPEVQAVEPMVADELLAQIVAELAEDGKITYHASVMNYRGFVAAVRSFISELKRAEITPSQFADFARRKGAAAKDRELSAIYARYQDVLHTRDLYDAEGRFWRARLLVEDGRLGPFAGLRKVFLDAFHDFTPAQLGLIEALGKRGIQITLSLPYDDAPHRSDLFQSARATLERLEKRFRTTLEPQPVKAVVKPDLRWLSEHLFDARHAPDPPEPNAIGLIETPGTPSEVREIAREIKRLHLVEHIPLERFGVVFRTLGEYRDIVEEVFDEFGIPFRMTQGLRLSLTSIGQLVLHIVRVPADGWRSRDVMSLLKSNYVGADAVALSDEALALSRFEELAIEAGVIAGAESWRRNLRAFRERVIARLESAGSDTDEEIKERTDTEGLAKKVADLERALDVCEKLFDLFAELAAATTIDACVDALLGLVDRLAIEENILRGDDHALASRDLAALAAVRSCLGALVRTAALVGEGRCTPEAFAGKLHAVFSDKTVARGGAEFGRVQVCDVHGVRAMAFDVVFIGGLLERSFPRMHREGPFYDDAERARMHREGLPIEPRRLTQREERFLFYLAATRAERKLYLSYPVTDREGKEKLVSYYVGEVKRLFAPHEIPCRRLTLSTRLVDVSESSSLRELGRATVLRLATPRLENARELVSAAALLGADRPRTALVLKRALEGEAERDSWQTFDVHDGVLSHPTAIKELTTRFGPEHGFSVSRLETYGGCPFAFFCASVLNLEPPAEAPEEIEAVDEGTLLHRTLREFYSERRDTLEEVRIGDDEIEAASARVCEIADAHLERFRRRNPDLNDGLFRLQRETMHEVLRGFVGAEVANRRRDVFQFVPTCFEVAFGLPVNPSADPRSTSNRLIIEHDRRPPIAIVGKIDRIDLGGLPTGGGAARGFRVIDYKRTYARRSARDIEEGTALQMPVYLKAASDVILSDEDAEAVDGQFYGLRGPTLGTPVRRFKSRKGTIEPDRRGDELIETAVGYIREYVTGIRHGDFPVLRRGTGDRCRYCDFRAICRYSERRAKNKLGERKPWFERLALERKRKAMPNG